MIRVFADGGFARDPRVDAGRHGGVLFTVETEGDLQRLFAITPQAKEIETQLRAIAGLAETPRCPHCGKRLN